MNQLKAPKMLQIMEVENYNTATSCNHEENNSSEDSKRATAQQTI